MNFKLLQKLSRSNKWQILYNRAKELGTLRLFKNDIDLTKIQIWMLYFLEMYSSLYTDLAMNEDFISEEVIQDDLRTEAYLLYRKEKSKKDKHKKYTDKEDKRVTPSDIPGVQFLKK